MRGNRIFQYLGVLSISGALIAMPATFLQAASICDGSICDTTQSLTALKQYEEQVDTWFRAPHDPYLSPHYGGLPLTLRDKHRAQDYVDTWTDEYDTEVSFEKTHPGDQQGGYPSFKSLIFHAIGPIFEKLTPDGIAHVKLPIGRSLWTSDDTKALMLTVGLAGPNILNFLDNIRYGEYGVKLYAAKNFKLTRLPDTSGVELAIIADYAYDVLTEEEWTGNATEDDVLAAKAIRAHIPPAHSLESGGYLGYYDGLLAEICGAVLDRQLIREGRLSYRVSVEGQSTYTSPLVGFKAAPTSATVKASQWALRSSSLIPKGLQEFYDFTDRVYSQFVVSASDLAVMGDGAMLYEPWTDADTDQLLAAMGAAVPAATPFLKAYSAGKLAGVEMAIKNDASLRSDPDFKSHVEEALLVEWAIGEALEKSETSPVGNFSSYSRVSALLRDKYVVTLTPEEQEYMDKLTESVGLVSLVKSAQGKLENH